ncbi:DUF1643 domain-containing protein [Streptomyces xanthochromogenes]|uniref:DUF1643 domain-containing protein n=1 Tax=Streptomyces xanthochromogenes TaxID=67384 RepID=UPI003823A026
MTLPEQIRAWATAHRLITEQHAGGSATYGTGRIHRYTLTRTWAASGSYAAFVLYNPSTATAETDDATVRRLISFARREGHGGLVLANVFAVRSRNPYALFQRDAEIGPHNNELLAFLADTVTDITVGWGMRGSLPRAQRVEQLLLARGARLWALGTTKHGYPRHPLYLPNSAPLTRYRPPSTSYWPGSGAPTGGNVQPGLDSDGEGDL